MLELHKQIYSIFKVHDFEIKSDTISFAFSEELKAKLETLNIEFEQIRDEEVVIEKNDVPVQIYYDHRSYLKITEIPFTNVLILNLNGKSYSLIDGQTYIDFEIQNENYFFSNSLSFIKFVDFIKSLDLESEDAFHFVDYVNDLARKMIFTSLTDKGRIIIKWYSEVFHFSESTNYSLAVEEFKNCFNEQNNHLPKFLKSAIITYSSRFNEKDRIFELFKSLFDVLTTAKMNFEIYLNNLSIDKIRKEYDEYKSKYFKELSDVLNNITQKIIGLPIAIAATLFAIEKVSENSEFLTLLIFVIAVTHAYLILLLKINFKDLSYILLVSNKDFKVVSENDFFVKYPSELEIFQAIKKRITDRVRHLRIITESYFWVLGMTNIALISLIFHYFKLDFTAIFMFSIVCLFILTITRNQILNDLENKSIA